MQLFQDFFDQSKQLNQAPYCKQQKLPFHIQTQKYPSILIALKIPNLPAPLHYLNLFIQLGQLNLPILHHAHAKSKNATNQIYLMSSCSAHMVGQFQCDTKEATFHLASKHIQCADHVDIYGEFPKFQFQREHQELSLDLQVNSSDLVSCITKLRMGMAEYWSVLSQCAGKVVYKGQIFDIAQLGTLEFARARAFPYFPVAFYSMSMLNLSNDRQLMFMQVRDARNQIVQSRIYLRDLKANKHQMFDTAVHFRIHRVYPKITTPNARNMYLPREFEWFMQNETMQIRLQGQSRGDFKFGLGAGYAGSFSYRLQLNEEQEEGEEGYSEYIDCRNLNWQEHHQDHLSAFQQADSMPVLIKNK
ncbi:MULTISPECIES: DUF6670 family protein [Acinetobacter]|uniref:DUF6670 family protein n=1 Tax=Acinetobacter TaxID=469 RepID=UPI000EA0F218|nr:MULTISPECIES: DUF6670 family protein [Acinetobacter]RKG43386.1 hypothetical protein D7V51_09345 [Acinetobacter cumulans]RZG59278.1 hypothetical protein EXE29_08165 [Acinetobacter sp. WCHAc060006]